MKNRTRRHPVRCGVVAGTGEAAHDAQGCVRLSDRPLHCRLRFIQLVSDVRLRCKPAVDANSVLALLPAERPVRRAELRRKQALPDF